MIRNPHLIKPGVLEVFTGPMRSGKSLALQQRVDKLQYLTGIPFLMFKPSLDTRDKGIYSRFTKKNSECILIDANNPKEILKHLNGHKFVGIDEAHFFSKDIVFVIKKLIDKKVNVVVSGLDLDFRGEPFGSMPDILCFADEVHKLYAVCDYKNCNNLGRYTQRIVNGEPAHYDSQLILVGDESEGYEARCYAHHIVPGKPE